jgi:hypothetical protein
LSFQLLKNSAMATKITDGTKEVLVASGGVKEVLGSTGGIKEGSPAQMRPAFIALVVWAAASVFLAVAAVAIYRGFSGQLREFYDHALLSGCLLGSVIVMVAYLGRSTKLGQIATTKKDD